MYQSNTIISSGPRGSSSFERDALREYEEKEAAKRAKAEFDATPEGRAMARAGAAIRQRQAEDRAVEKAAREVEQAKIKSEAEWRATAEASLGGAATPKLIDMWVKSAMEIEASGRTFEESYRWRDPRTGARPD